MLELGGTAVDAAVASAFVLAVVEPSMSGIGGRVQILIRTPDGEHVGIDGTTQAPSSYDPDTAPQADYGYAVIGVPGVPAGLLEAHGRFGVLPRSTVMGPAIRLAEEGFELLPLEAERHAASAEMLAEFEGSRQHFLKPDGTTYRAGEVFRQPALAETLRAISEGGAAAFYTGDLARRMAADITANGGAVDEAALAEYEALDSRIVRDDYRGYDLVGLWIPSFGAITIEILNLMETLDASAHDETEWALALSEAIRVAYQDRSAQREWEDAARLTSDEYAADRAGVMRDVDGLMGASAAGGSPREGAHRLALGTGEDRTMVTAALRASRGSGAPVGASLAEDGHTTHLTAADRDGMVVALTQSLGPSMGSRVASPGLGFLYAATLGGYLGRMEGGARARSHISPFMVERDGEPFLALGAAGGGRIPTAITAVVSRVIDRGATLEEALRAPRIVPLTPTFENSAGAMADLPVAVEVVEGLGFSAEELSRMETLGWTVDPDERDGRFGRVHAVQWDRELRVWRGAADPDWEGAAASPRGSVR
jgi:gamma-glutamyltranspeptidase/glutathione hydrolase